jgi:hypothetical protein
MRYINYLLAPRASGTGLLLPPCMRSTGLPDKLSLRAPMLTLGEAVSPLLL